MHYFVTYSGVQFSLCHSFLWYLHHQQITQTSFLLDLWEPSPMMSHNDHKCYFIIMDDYSRFCWLFPFFLKANYFKTFVHFYTIMSHSFQYLLSTIQYDDGGKFILNEFNHLCNDNGIHQGFSCLHTPQQNGAVERKHCHIYEVGKCFLSQSKVPTKFWVEAFQNVIFIIPRFLSLIIDIVFSFEILYRCVPNYNLLKSYDCRCYPLTTATRHNELEPTTKTHCSFGYSPMHKGYICLDENMKKICVSQYVKFNESTFPFLDKVAHTYYASVIIVHQSSRGDDFTAMLQLAQMTTSQSSPPPTHTAHQARSSIPSDTTSLACHLICRPSPACTLPSTQRSPNPLVDCALFLHIHILDEASDKAICLDIFTRMKYIFLDLLSPTMPTCIPIAKVKMMCLLVNY